ncbi:MAG: flagellar FlbD family protein, partial [Planctomycetes bacterium]|nr:flagellar FlbD family protein [Planctomycetota bacterium]
MFSCFILTCFPSRSSSMIRLTRLDGEAFILNADLIKYVE